MDERSPLSRQGNHQEEDPFAAFPPVRTFVLSQRAKAIILLLLAIGAIIFLALRYVGQQEGAQSTPQKAVEGFLQAAQAKDPEKMLTYVSVNPADLREDQSLKDIAAEWKKAFMEEELVLGEYEILEVEEQTNSANVRYRQHFAYMEEKYEQESNHKLKKIGDKWFIVLG
ncbi:DUF4878 domain-containing protein [Cohnella boryungensis]|uniref:DUF4878 domain-containing protein n=1 Tax=Cohnella boryungensis TaxID=768479 RepID=A0ABV8S5Y6_9BACL